MVLYRENELALTNEDEEQELIFGENNPDMEQFNEAIKNRVPKDLSVFNKVENEDYTESNQRSAVQFYVFANGIPMVITLEQIKRIIGSTGGGTLGGIKFRVEGESLEVSYDDGETWVAIGIVKGEDGKTPYIQDGYWYINGVNTNVKAEGVNGKSAYEYAKEGGFKGTEAEFAQKIAKEIPSKVSQLENDSNFLTEVPSEYVTETELNNKGYLTEHQSLTDYAKKSELPSKTSQLTNDSGFIKSSEAPVQSVNGKTGAVKLSATDVGARPNTWTPNYSDVGAEKSGAVATHNTNTEAHNDIRIELKALAERINAVLDSDDTTLDELSEIVAYIKANKALIDGVTTSKVNVSDIINNLTSNVTNKPLSAAQGVTLKKLIDAITVPTKVSELDNDIGFLTSIPSEYVTETELGNKGYLTQGDLQTATNNALAQAKESGEFDGADGKDANTVPEYIVAEAEETAKKVLNHQSADSFTIAWLSDMHVGHVYQALGWKPDETSVIEAGQGLYELNKECPVDVIALGGDLAAGVHNTTREVELDQIDKCEKYMRPSTFSIPTLHLRGNHDDAPYQATEGRLTPNDVFQRIGRKNISSGANIVKGKNYGYRDFEAQKMRVIYLDTHDKEGWVSTQFVLNEDDSCPYLNACNVSAAQLDWLANTALNFSDKEVPSEWGIVICSHTQLDIHATPWTYTDETTGTSYEANTTNVITILTAYLTKGSGGITLNGETMSYDFSTLTDKAYLYCCINGHNHCEKTYTYGSKGILGIACPAVRDGAERVSADGNTYIKTAGTGDSTSFTVITIDRVNNKIYADIHGAGTDREFDVVVYSDYINVLEIAYTPPTANSVTPIDTSVFEGVGYRNGVRLSGWALKDNADYVVTGVIKWRENVGDFSGLKPIYIKGASLDTSKSYVRCNIISNNDGLYIAKAVESATTWAQLFTIETLGENYYKLTPLESGLSSWYNICYIQFSLFGTGDNLIITIDEKIV